MSVGKLAIWRDPLLKTNVSRSAEQGTETTLQGTWAMTELTDMTSPNESVSLMTGSQVQVSD